MILHPLFPTPWKADTWGYSQVLLGSTRLPDQHARAVPWPGSGEGLSLTSGTRPGFPHTSDFWGGGADGCYTGKQAP